eukprot:g5262.t1
MPSSFDDDERDRDAFTNATASAPSDLFPLLKLMRSSKSLYIQRSGVALLYQLGTETLICSSINTRIALLYAAASALSILEKKDNDVTYLCFCCELVSALDREDEKNYDESEKLKREIFASNVPLALLALLEKTCSEPKSPSRLQLLEASMSCLFVLLFDRDEMELGGTYGGAVVQGTLEAMKLEPEVASLQIYGAKLLQVLAFCDMNKAQIVTSGAIEVITSALLAHFDVEQVSIQVTGLLHYLVYDMQQLSAPGAKAVVCGLLSSLKMHGSCNDVRGSATATLAVLCSERSEVLETAVTTGCATVMAQVLTENSIGDDVSDEVVDDALSVLAAICSNSNPDCQKKLQESLWEIVQEESDENGPRVLDMIMNSVQTIANHGKLEILRQHAVTILNALSSIHRAGPPASLAKVAKQYGFYEIQSAESSNVEKKKLEKETNADKSLTEKKNTQNLAVTVSSEKNVDVKECMKKRQMKDTTWTLKSGAGGSATLSGYISKRDSRRRWRRRWFELRTNPDTGVLVYFESKRSTSPKAALPLSQLVAVHWIGHCDVSKEEGQNVNKKKEWRFDIRVKKKTKKNEENGECEHVTYALRTATLLEARWWVSALREVVAGPSAARTDASGRAMFGDVPLATKERDELNVLRSQVSSTIERCTELVAELKKCKETRDAFATRLEEEAKLREEVTASERETRMLMEEREDRIAALREEVNTIRGKKKEVMKNAQQSLASFSDERNAEVEKLTNEITSLQLQLSAMEEKTNAAVERKNEMEELLAIAEDDLAAAEANGFLGTTRKRARVRAGKSRYNVSLGQVRRNLAEAAMARDEAYLSVRKERSSSSASFDSNAGTPVPRTSFSLQPTPGPRHERKQEEVESLVNSSPLQRLMKEVYDLLKSGASVTGSVSSDGTGKRGGLKVMHFNRFLKQCDLLTTPKMRAEAGVIVAESSGVSSREISFESFCQILSRLASRRHPNVVRLHGGSAESALKYIADCHMLPMLSRLRIRNQNSLGLDGEEGDGEYNVSDEVRDALESLLLNNQVQSKGKAEGDEATFESNALQSKKKGFICPTQVEMPLIEKVLDREAVPLREIYQMYCDEAGGLNSSGMNLSKILQFGHDFRITPGLISRATLQALFSELAANESGASISFKKFLLFLGCIAMTATIFSNDPADSSLSTAEYRIEMFLRWMDSSRGREKISSSIATIRGSSQPPCTPFSLTSKRLTFIPATTHHRESPKMERDKLPRSRPLSAVPKPSKRTFRRRPQSARARLRKRAGSTYASIHSNSTLKRR